MSEPSNRYFRTVEACKTCNETCWDLICAGFVLSIRIEDLKKKFCKKS